jgi:alpha-D-xyloside xylohydrolase
MENGMIRADRGGLHPARAAALVVLFVIAAPRAGMAQAPPVLGDPIDVSQEFRRLEQSYFVASRVTDFDPATGRGTLQWDRYARQPNYSFAKVDLDLARARPNEFPGTEYDADPALPFAIDFISPRTVRLRLSTRNVPIQDTPSLMLAGPPRVDRSWRMERTDSIVTWTGEYGTVRLITKPWHVEFYDAAGKLLTRTRNIGEPHTYSSPMPFSFIRRANDFGRSTAAAFELAHDEKIFGTGESFTRLDKRGQKVVLFTRDAMGAQTERMYKPIPFFLSSRGYGMFVHTSAPATFDFGHDFDESEVLYTGDEMMDLFVFLGDPKEVLSEYTGVTGRSPVPPLWSFGLWMSRITYKSEAEVREVAARLRQERIPADVLHLDTGWFETDWQSTFKFSGQFADPGKMMTDLAKDGFHISLWQLPYFTAKNPLFPEIVQHGYNVRNENGVLPAEDAVLDMSNPDAVKWYQGKLGGLLKMGASVIKVDFGEGAPVTGRYASGRSGWYEHNLYPLRYNQAVFDVTREVKGAGEGIIWARSAWAGSQRYPLHWGGDAENTNSAMAAQLRGGLSFGLSGFTYWSHDMGGFVDPAPRGLYRRWVPFGMLTSHSRAHGAPPKEPWGYDPAFVDDYRRAVNLKYELMPYVYAQAKESSANGWPMLRTLFFEFPDDPTSWSVEDEYLFGSDLLVAPLFEEVTERDVYLPPGQWMDYQTGRAYEGARWHRIAAGPIPIVLLIRDHVAIPRAAVAQNTAEIDWKNVELRVFSSDGAPVRGRFALPEGELQTVELAATGGDFVVRDDPLRGAVKWRVTR